MNTRTLICSHLYQSRNAIVAILLDGVVLSPIKRNLLKGKAPKDPKLRSYLPLIQIAPN